MTISLILSGRQSVRAFANRTIDPETLTDLFEAARWAPSNGNRQPWRFIVRESNEARAALSPCLTRGNQWALAAPVLAVLVTRVSEDSLSNGIPYAFYDCGLAAMSLVVEAETRGLRVHQMAGWNREPLVALLHLPENVDPVTVIAIGYEGDASLLSPELQEKERRQRIRKPLDQVWTKDLWSESWE